MKQQKKGDSRRQFLRQTAAIGLGITIVPSYVLGGSRHIAPSDKITLGFIGTGKQSGGLGSRFMQQVPDIQMVAACDVDTDKLEKFKMMVNKHYAEATDQTDYKGCDTHFEYSELLNRDDIDAVIIATPDHWHAIQCVEAMQAGKDVYCEKPLAHTIEEGRAIVKTAKKTGKILQTGSMQRSQHNFRHAVNLVWNDHIGDLKTVLVNVGDPAKPCDLPSEPTPVGLNWDRWLGPAPIQAYNNLLAPALPSDFWPKWRDYKEFGGGILSDWGAHMFDIAQWGMGMDDSGPVEFIPPTDRNAVRGLRMIYENGIEMRHEDFGRGWAVRFEGTKGKIEVSRQFLESDIEGLVEREIGANEKQVYFSDNHYQDWIDAVKKRSNPICDAETGHRSASICNLANIAYQLGRPLTWDPRKEKFKGDREANSMRGKDYREPYVL